MNDPELSNAAIGQLSGSDTATDYEKVIESFLNFSENDQAKLLFKAGEQQIMQFLPVARDMDNIKSAQVKTAALNYLTFCGDASDLSLLIKYAGSNDANVRDAARNALYRIKGKDINKGILDLAEDADPSARIELIKAIGERRIMSGYGVLKSLPEDENRRVRVESYSALSIIDDPENISELLQIFDRIENEAEMKRMENTLAKIALKKEDRNLRAKELIEAINSEGDFEKEMSLLRILGATGDPNAYNVIKNYLIDENEDIVETAIQSLYNWPNIDPLADLIDIAEKSENEIHRVLALRGYINLVKVHSGEVPEKAADLYADALKVSVDDAEKKMILSGLAEVKTLAAANLAFSLLKDPNLKAEAEICLIDILNTVRWSHPDEAYDILSDIAAEASTDDIKFQASTIMKRIARDK